jgi:hypothetical protein
MNDNNEDFEQAEEPKTQNEIEEQTAKLETQVWYNRCYLAILGAVIDGTEKRPPDDIRNPMIASALKAESEYPDIALEELNDRELGRIEGQLYALRWVPFP